MENETIEQHMMEEGKMPTTSIKYNKTEQSIMANRFIQDALDGNENPLHRFIALRNLEESVSIALERIKGDAMIEADKLAKGGDRVLGVNVSTMEGRRTFDYSGDSVWLDLKNKMKDREDFLKGLKEPMSDMQGVISNPPMIKYSGATIVLKFDK
jgi:hypothetical protein